MKNEFNVEVSRTFDATPQQIWDALTKPELVKQYFFGVDLVTDWKEGSPISYKGMWEGKPFEEKGNVLKVIPLQELHTNYYSPSSGLPDSPENYQQVIYKISPEADGKTTLSIFQDNNASEESKTKSAANWTQVLANLQGILTK
jgi:uncharacterized protein YndB with AHSA1/START domain